jgi:hypothetical protein
MSHSRSEESFRAAEILRRVREDGISDLFQNRQGSFGGEPLRAATTYGPSPTTRRISALTGW